ncbi:MAG: carboxymuconolactone decarboxylase family protein [Pirellulales bacterium]
MTDSTERSDPSRLDRRQILHAGLGFAAAGSAVWSFDGCAQSQASAQMPSANTMENSDGANRVDRATHKYQQLFGPKTVAESSDPELMDILQRLIFGEVFYIGNLDDKTRELITITVLATDQTLPQLKAHTNAALNIGVTPVEIREVIYQAAPFVGFPKVLNALGALNEVFRSKGIQLPLEAQGTVTESQRFEKGKEKQHPLYGDAMA